MKNLLIFLFLLTTNLLFSQGETKVPLLQLYQSGAATNQVVQWNGTNWAPSSSLPVSIGGTGATTFVDNRVLTGTGTSAITDESNLTFDGSKLGVTGTAYVTGKTIDATSGGGMWLYTSTTNNFGGSAGNKTLSQDRNTGFGHNALSSLTSGVSNTAFGYNAGLPITSGSGNMLFGDNSFWRGAGSSSYNVGIGASSLSPSSSAIALNNCIGIGAGSLINLPTSNTGSIAIGFYAGYSATRNYSFFLDYNGGLVSGNIPTMSGQLDNHRIGIDILPENIISKLHLRTNNLGTTQNISSGILLENSTPASAGAQQISPAFTQRGYGWKTNATAASQSVDFRTYVIPVEGTSTPTGRLQWESSIAGSGYSTLMVLTNDGKLGLWGNTAPAYTLTVPNTSDQICAQIGSFNFNNSVNGGAGTGLGIAAFSGASYLYNTNGPVSIKTNTAFGTESERLRVEGVGTVKIGGSNITTSAWGFNGVGFQCNGGSNGYSDNSTATSGTATNMVVNSFGIPNIGTLNTGITFTNSANVYIAGAPTSITSSLVNAATLTNKYALWVGADHSRFDGSVAIGAISPSVKLHISTGLANTTAIQRLENTSGDIDLFVTSGTPESVVTGNVGDIAYNVAGAPYYKKTGTATTTGWKTLDPQSITLDEAYNNFGATASKITIDAAESQTGGLVIESTTADNFTVNLASTGDFNIKDNGSQFAQFGDNGNVGFGINAQTGTRLTVQQSASGTQIAEVLRNGIDEDGQGIGLDLNNAGIVHGRIVATNPTGSLTSALDLMTPDNSGTLSSFHTMQRDGSQNQLHKAIYYDVYNGTSTTETLTGLVSIVNVPSTATTTTINLPEIVSGVPSTNQVNIGYILELSIENASAITIQRAGTSDVIMVNGSTSTVTSITTTGGTYYVKRYIAVELNKWVVF